VSGPAKGGYQHDVYRPYDMIGLQPGWRQWLRSAGVIASQALGSWRYGFLRGSSTESDSDAVEGAPEPPYSLPNIMWTMSDKNPASRRVVAWCRLDANHLRLKSLYRRARSGGKAGSVEYRQRLCSERASPIEAGLDQRRWRWGGPAPRSHHASGGCSILAAEKAGWGKTVPERHGAVCGAQYGLPTIWPIRRGGGFWGWQVQVHRVVCGVDCEHGRENGPHVNGGKSRVSDFRNYESCSVRRDYDP